VIEYMDSFDDKTSFDGGLKVIVSDHPTTLALRGSGKEVKLERDDILRNVITIVDQITRVHKNPKKMEKALAHRFVIGLISRGAKLLSDEEREHIRHERQEGARAAKLREREASRREQAMRRQIEEGTGLPDDLEVIEEDKARQAAGTKLGNEVLQKIADKQLATARPCPEFFPCDPVHVDFDHLCSFVPGGPSQGQNFKDTAFGTFGPLQDRQFSTTGILFAEQLSIWTGLRFLAPLLPKVQSDLAELTNFAMFRMRLAQSELDHLFVALLHFLSEDARSNDSGGSGTSSTSKMVLAVEDVAGIATRRGRRVGRGGQSAYASTQQAVKIPNYPYNSDELWPVPAECLNEISWPEVARRALVHLLQKQDEKIDEDEDEEDETPVTRRKLTALKKAIKTDPDLLSTCDEIISTILDDPTSSPFATPVDPVRHDAPNYFEVVKRPMDLETVQTRLRTGHYDPEHAPDSNRYQEIIEWKPEEDEEDEDEDEDEDVDEESGSVVKVKAEEGEGLGETADGAEKAPPKIRSEFEYYLALDQRFYDMDCLGGGHEGLAADIRQIWRNCRLFNKAHTKLYNDSKKLENVFHKLYNEKVLKRDPRLLYEDDAAATAVKTESGPDGQPVVAPALAPTAPAVELNTVEEIGPYQRGLPPLAEVVLELNRVGDIAQLSLGSKLRVIGSLLEMAQDTSAVRHMVSEREKTLANVAKDYAKKLREDQKRERELVNRGSTGEEELAAHREEMETRRSAYETDLSNNAIRLEAAGLDRFYNRYWVIQAVSPYILVEMARTGQWGMFVSREAIESLIDSLDVRGARENALHRCLREAWPSLERKIEQARTAAQERIKAYSSLKSGEDTHKLAEIEQAQQRLDKGRAELARVSEEASNYRSVETPDGKTYYFHRTTRATSWEIPEALKEKTRHEEIVAGLEKALELAKAAPEEVIEQVKLDLQEDSILQEALVRCRGDLTVSADDLVSEERESLSRCGKTGFALRTVDLIAYLMALEAVSASPQVDVSLCADEEDWIGEPEGGKLSKRKQWLESLTSIIRQLNEQAEWKDLLGPLQAAMNTFYANFIGNPYEVLTDRAQLAVLAAIKHQFRWTRAIERAKSIAELGLLFAQLVKILQLNAAKLRSLDKHRRAIFAELRTDVALLN